MRWCSGIIAAATIGAATTAGAATLVTDESGHLVGAKGVTVGSATYDVSFVDGSCAGLFGGCDANSDFTFPGSDEAHAAADALLAQVFIGAFDTDYTLTAGCSTNIDFEGCLTLVPWYTDGSNVTAAAAYNQNFVDDFGSTDNGVDINADTTGNGSYVWATFTPASSDGVPEPSTWAMLALGFGALGAQLRVMRRRRAAAW